MFTFGCPAWCFVSQFFRKNAVFWYVIANVVPSSPILVTLMMEAMRSSKTSVLTRATLRNIPEEGILHCHRRENLLHSINRLGYVAET
jgi:hypothetical protein